MKNKFDLIVLGAGSGGLAAARRAASFGMKVAVVEGDKVGGTCVVRGCVPKKLLVYASNYYNNLTVANDFGVKFNSVSVNVKVLLSNVRKEVNRLNDLYTQTLNEAGIELIKGWGSFLSANSILISKSKNGDPITKIEGENILIAVGGRPLRPNIPGNALGWISDQMFSINNYPKDIVIVGAGYIACEFSCILDNLGINVTHLVRGKRLLKEFDSEISSQLEDSMRAKGIKLCFSETPIEIQGEEGQLEIFTNHKRTIKSGGLLWATGREPFTEGLGLEMAGIKLINNKLLVDQHQRTNVSNIYALGDVTNSYNLTPVAIEEGRIFSDNVFGSKNRFVDYNLIPTAVFSQPEISSVGLSEDMAIDKYGIDNVKVYRSKFKPMSESLMKKSNRCLLKLIVSLPEEKILGCHMIGESSSEIIQMASISLKMGATKSDFDITMALHPTIAEEFVTMK